MKSIIIAVAFLAAAVQAGPVKEPNRNGALAVPELNNVTVPEGACGSADLDRIQAKLTEVLEKQIEQLLGGHVPEGGLKSRRSTSEAAAASRVEPDGTIKTAAAAKGSNDPSMPVPEPALTTNGHQLPPQDSNKRILPEEGAGAPGLDGDLPPPPPSVGEPVHPPPVAQPEVGAPVQPTHPIAGSGNIVQKVASKANMDTGTSVASAIAKRAAVLQTVDTSGGKAVANAEAHRGADTNVQAVSANGTHIGIANALVDNRNASANVSHTGPEVVLQNVAASGVKAVATATNNKGTGSSIQEAVANGEELSIVSAVAARAKREAFLITREDVSIPEEEDDGSYKPDKEEDQVNAQDEIVLIRQRVARSPCISTKMDENLRKLIQDTVATVFADLKKELKL